MVRRRRVSATMVCRMSHSPSRRRPAPPVAAAGALPRPSSASPRPPASTSRPSPAPSIRTRGTWSREPVAARVLAEAARLGYRPDAAAAALRTGRSRLVGALVPGIANPVFAPILAGAEAVLAARGYALLVADPGDDPARAAALADGMASRRVDGLLLATAAGRDDPVVSRCLARGTPVVLINRAEAEPRAPSVVSDDREGMRLAVEHLAGLGHRRIGHVAGPPSLSTGDLRRRGFEAAMAAHGLDAAAVEPADRLHARGRGGGRAAAARAPPGPHRAGLRQRPAGARRLRRAGGSGPARAARTSRSPGTTTCRWWTWWRRRSPPCASPIPRWGARPRTCCCAPSRTAPPRRPAAPPCCCGPELVVRASTAPPPQQDGHPEKRGDA